MAVRLRLRRTGTINKPCYRIVATDSRSPRDGRFIEVIGFYDPRHSNEKIDLDRADYWIRHGAQPSEVVGHIIKRAKRTQAGEPMKSVTPQKTNTSTVLPAEPEAVIAT
jgi:small subunit ribosomal protein S16